MAAENEDGLRDDNSLMVVAFSDDFVSSEALLKACYWLSRDFECDVSRGSNGNFTVRLQPKPTCRMSPQEAREQITALAIDFTLREKVARQTAEVRELLLAKAFSESGVLEDQPEGVFGDSVEEEKPNGMFKILSNS
jgi:His-Xaa-Ser system protein HxsD